MRGGAYISMASTTAHSLEDGTQKSGFRKDGNPMTESEEAECRLITKAFDIFITSRFTVFVVRAFFVVLLVRIILDIMIEVFMLHGVVNNPAMKNGEMSISMARHML